MHRTDAHPAAFMVQAISMAAFSWAWAPGRIGATATAGAVIASEVVEEEGTLPAEETADALMQAIEAPTPQWCVVAATLQQCTAVTAMLQ